MDNKDIGQHDLNSLEVDQQTETGITPHPQPLTPAYAALEPKKSHKGRNVLITLLVLVLLIAAGVSAYYFYLKPRLTPQTTHSTATTSKPTAPVADTTDYAKDLITKVTTAEAGLKTQYPNAKADQAPTTSTPMYKYGSDNYYITGAQGYSTTITSSSLKDATDPAFQLSTAAEATANTVLTAEKELTKSTTDASGVYQNKNVICNVSIKIYPAYISCANTRDYATTSSTVAPIAKAYFVSAGTANESTTVFMTPQISNKKEGYTSATVGIGTYGGLFGAGQGLFYGKDGQWIFWKIVQNGLMCSDYNTHALQVAFEGAACGLDTGKDGVVTVTL